MTYRAITPEAAIALARAMADWPPDGAEVELIRKEPDPGIGYLERIREDDLSSRRGRRSMKPKARRRLFKP